MKFYIPDDLKVLKEHAKGAPDAQCDTEWCDAIEVDRNNGDSKRCPVCGRPVSMLEWLEPRKVRLSKAKYPDRLTSWLTEPMVVSERVKAQYEKENLSGIREFVPIEVVKVGRLKEKSPKPPRYFCAIIDYTTSVKIDLSKTVIGGQKCDWSCELCNPWGITVDHITQLALDTTNWNGDDIFRVYSLGVVVSQRFYNLIKENGYTNFNLGSIEEYQR